MVVYSIINEIWTVPDEQLKKLIDRQIPYINHYFYCSRNPDVVCNPRLLYLGKLRFQLNTYDLPNKTFQFYFKNENNIYQLIEKCPNYEGNIFVVENVDELEIKMTGLFVVENNEYPHLLRTQHGNFGVTEKEDKNFKIIVKNGKMEYFKKLFRLFSFNNIKSFKPQKLLVHKELLIAQSPVFEAMFNSGMKEARKNTLKIIDFKYETVKAAVDFFYGQDIFKDSDLSDVFELLRFADKYDIAELRESVENFCIFLVSPSTVVEIANYSILINSLKLQHYCRNFIIMCTKHSTQIGNFKLLDLEFASEVFNEFCILR